jgi:hypothetical protein
VTDGLTVTSKLIKRRGHALRVKDGEIFGAEQELDTD